MEIHFDLGHVGTATGFEFKVFWGSTVLVERMAKRGGADDRGQRRISSVQWRRATAE